MLSNTKWCCDKALIPKGADPGDRSALTLKAFTQKPHKRICGDERYAALAAVMKRHDTWTLPGSASNSTVDHDRWRWPPVTDPSPKHAATTSTTRTRAAKRAFDG